MRRKYSLVKKGDRYNVFVNDQNVGSICRKVAGNKLWYAVDETSDIGPVIAYNELTKERAFSEFKKYIRSGKRNTGRMERNKIKRRG